MKTKLLMLVPMNNFATQKTVYIVSGILVLYPHWTPNPPATLQGDRDEQVQE